MTERERYTPGLASGTAVRKDGEKWTPGWLPSAGSGRLT